MNVLARVPTAALGHLRCASNRRAYCSCSQHMHSNGLVILNSINTSAVVTSIEKALSLCTDTVFVDLRQAPGCGTGIMDVVGTIYGCVAGLAPCRNVVPLLRNHYPPGDLVPSLDYDRVFEVSSESSQTLHVLSYARGDRCRALRTSWDICQPDDSLVLRPTAVIPPEDSQRVPFSHVALGGTFDRLHSGHRLLLAAAAAITSGSLYVGVTGVFALRVTKAFCYSMHKHDIVLYPDDKLLAGKQYQQLIHTYDERVLHVRHFLKQMCPDLQPVMMRLDDPLKPTRAETEKGMEALVVSEETLKGGARINDSRIKANFPTLVLFVVPVLGVMSEGEKLSSTSLRRADAEKLQLA